MEKIAEECPRNHIISVRVSDEQMLHLKHLIVQRHTTVSELIREALSTLAVSPCETVENRIVE